ncbi:hypothetical protein MIND_00775100 [Mycena indigotica]|uniref:DNA polymerase delta subunit 4 n=1 Tax=Mycena indigotica TaxID=2126181 RepID=A0A8H6W1H8_9AGAR|nr:uncharacterized protein MIND_00775100 [Mycena indigotica]KAF7302084.1 hypothetical protein MIND_00775100 [Mycena indigotica]
MPKAPKAKSSSQPTLKQSTLAFSAFKQNASTNTNKKTAPILPRNPPEDNVVDEIEIASSGSGSEVDSDIEIIESDGSFADKSTVARVPAPSTPTKKPKRDEIIDIDDDDDDEPLDISPKQRRWQKHAKEVKSKRGHDILVHAQAQTIFDDILRVFDLSYEYGPCVGISRLQRWERAQAMGLSPPIEVRDILKSKQGPRYAESVLIDQATKVEAARTQKLSQLAESSSSSSDSDAWDWDSSPPLQPKSLTWIRTGEDQTGDDEILRHFDHAPEYGPTVGMTRLERWERAHKLGLKPPNAVRPPRLFRHQNTDVILLRRLDFQAHTEQRGKTWAERLS